MESALGLRLHKGVNPRERERYRVKPLPCGSSSAKPAKAHVEFFTSRQPEVERDL